MMIKFEGKGLELDGKIQVEEDGRMVGDEGELDPRGRENGGREEALGD
jgi:hypothetical protein